MARLITIYMLYLDSDSAWHFISKAERNKEEREARKSGDYKYIHADQFEMEFSKQGIVDLLNRLES